MAEEQIPNRQPLLARSLEELKPLHQFCRKGRLYEVASWISEGRPLHIDPAAIIESPAFGVCKRYRTEDPKIRRELNLALRYQVREGSEKG